MGLRAGLHVLQNRKIYCPRPDSKPVPFNQHSSTSIDYAIPTTTTKKLINPTLRRRCKFIFVTEMLGNVHRPMHKKPQRFGWCTRFSSSNEKLKERNHSGGVVRKGSPGTEVIQIPKRCEFLLSDDGQCPIYQSRLWKEIMKPKALGTRNESVIVFVWILPEVHPHS